VYTVAVRRDFVAQHVLTAGSGGPEHVWHSHSYRLEVRLEGPALDTSGYLVDISEVERHLDAFVGRVRDRTLNDQPELAGRNPSLEHFARFACEALRDSLHAPGVHALTARVWESPTAWASFRLELSITTHPFPSTRGETG
jgi:6-pyruvoyltetrahydropterin/6-carboxytetrahydropterin synthase